jgi:tRNA modification GTPase
MGMTDDTIAAIATPVGMGGIGIIKISGEKALDIATRVFRPRNAAPPLKSHFLYYGEIFDPHKKCAVDEVLLSFMAKPRSYTREDVVEINCHGGYLALQETLALVLKAGARLAEPGEFTKRAFLSGRIDLAQAEAVADLIESKTSLSLLHTSSQLKGSLSREISDLKDMLVDMLSALEASIDFPEEDLAFAPSSQLTAQTDRLLSRIETLLCSYDEGKLYREGASTIIAGKPNAGKSCLFNALLEEERAIVTPVPGTTRDFIEEVIAVKGIPLKIIDTAGLRDPSDSIEEEGVRRTREKLDQADLVLLVIDSSVKLDDRDRSLFSDVSGKRVVVVENKNDLPGKIPHDTVQGWFPESRAVSISALYGKGIEELKEAIFSSLTAEVNSLSSPLLISNLRHKRALEKTLESIQHAREGLQKKIPPEFTASDFQAALHSLGEITGHTTSEDILHQIFSRFCIGK